MTATVGVVGLGLMGSGIAEVCARAGHPVRVVETDHDLLAAGLARIRGSMQRGVERGKLSEADAAAALGRIAGTVALSDLAGSAVVIEAIIEDEGAKTDLFHRLDETLGDDTTLLASNTSAIAIGTLAAATSHPSRVIGLHFFNPAPVMELVEIVPALGTSSATLEAAQAFVAGLGKSGVVARDQAGFVVNALLVPYLLAAIRMVEAGTATAGDIDTAMRLGCSHPMGPLELADLAGLDTVAAAAASLHREYGEALYAPPPLLRRMVAAGRLGRKSGRGFFRYDEPGVSHRT